MKRTDYTKGALFYLIAKVIKPQVKDVLRVIADKLPEPTEETVNHENAKVLCRIRDEHFKREKSKNRMFVFKAIWNLLITIYDYDSFYTQRIDWVIEKVQESEFEKRDQKRPLQKHWRHDEELLKEVING